MDDRPTSILIVEDEAIVAMDLRSELQGLGYVVLDTADTAEQAVRQVRRLRPDLVLLDIMLREGDGVQVAEAVRAEGDTPVIFLTSFSDPDTVARAAGTGAHGYLTKPFQAKELRAGIEVAMWKVRLERRLREADRWFAATLRCVHDGVVVVDAALTVRFVNAAAERMTGLTADEAVGRPAREVVRFADQDPRTPALLQRALDLQKVVGVRHGQALQRRDGSTLPVDESAGPVHDEQGRPMGAVLVLRDATERIAQEKLLRDSEERFRSAFAHAPLGMAMVSLGGRILQVNDALCRLLGRSADWLLDRAQASLSPPEDGAHEAERLATLHAEPDAMAQFEKRYLRADGAGVNVLVHVSLVRSNGVAVGLLYQVQDLTAQRAAAEQIAALAQERMRSEAAELAGRSKSEFLARISHEMRTPLNAVLGFAQLLKLQQAAGQPADHTYPDHILDAGRHLLALVDDLLDLQRAGDGTLRLHLAPLDLARELPAMVELLQPMAQEHGVQWHLALPPGLVVRADATRLRQVVLNIGSNAVKYNRKGGRVWLTAWRLADGRVRLQVRDDGIGLSAQQLAHLFEPFNRLGRETLRVPGIGLGLVITQRLMQHMGGDIAVHSGEGGGATVNLDFEVPGA